MFSRNRGKLPTYEEVTLQRYQTAGKEHEEAQDILAKAKAVELQTRHNLAAAVQAVHDMVERGR